MPRLSNAQRRVMTYLTHGHGYFAAWKEFARAYALFTDKSEFLQHVADKRTIAVLKRRGLVEDAGKGRMVPTAEAWALAHKGDLR